jgi:hypothetical protein
MRKPFSLGTMCLLMGLTATTLSSGQAHTGNKAIRDRFMGAWRLASLEAEGADGKIHQADSTGLLVFTRDGHMSVQVIERNPQPQPRAGTE